MLTIDEAVRRFESLSPNDKASVLGQVSSHTCKGFLPRCCDLPFMRSIVSGRSSWNVSLACRSPFRFKAADSRS